MPPSSTALVWRRSASSSRPDVPHPLLGPLHRRRTRCGWRSGWWVATCRRSCGAKPYAINPKLTAWPPAPAQAPDPLWLAQRLVGGDLAAKLQPEYSYGRQFRGHSMDSSTARLADSLDAVVSVPMKRHRM
jgi:hypothetical protein